MKIIDGKGRVELHDENSVRRVLALNGEVINQETLSVCMFDYLSRFKYHSFF